MILYMVLRASSGIAFSAFCLCCYCFFPPFPQPASRKGAAGLGVSFVHFIVIEGFPVRQSILTVALVYTLVNTPAKRNANH
jgi:hypothetical protein